LSKPQSHSASTGLAAFQVLGRKATPTPLILQLIEAVLHIRPVAVQLGHAIQSLCGWSHAWLCSPLIRANARRSASSLAIFSTPRISRLTPSPRNPVMRVYRLRPARIDSSHVPNPSSFSGAFGLLYLNGLLSRHLR
jgi:hypothetical protein